MSGYSTVAGSLGGGERMGETPTLVGGISSTVCHLSIKQAQENVERCCSCNRHSTCSTLGLSEWACECWNAGRNCMGCYCWGKFRNKGQLMMFPTIARGLLGHFPCGADPPSVCQCILPPPVQFPVSMSLWEILAARAGGEGCGASRANSEALRREEMGGRD